MLCFPTSLVTAWVIFFGVMLENAGVPVPGETILLAAGFFVAQGHFHLTALMAVAAIGALLGDNTGYAVGHRIGRTALERIDIVGSIAMAIVVASIVYLIIRRMKLFRDSTDARPTQASREI